MVEAPGVAALRRILLDRRAVRLEAHDAAADGRHAFRPSRSRTLFERAVAVRGVDPAVPAPARIVDDRVRVAGAEAGVELLDFVGLAVAHRCRAARECPAPA